MADTVPEAVPFQEAIETLRRKVRLPTRTWTDLWQGQHARAFVVAGAVKAALIEDFHKAVTRAIAEGRTLEQFREDFDRIVASHGWTYKGRRGWRSAVIYNTNMRMARAAGRWEQMQRVKERRPYLRYVAVLDSRTRPHHKAHHGMVLPVDDPWWDTWYPPNGWNCRCTVQQLSERDLARYGYKVSDDPPRDVMETRSIRTSDGGTAQVQVPQGIDTGFAYNPGRAAWGAGQQRILMEKHGEWQELHAPGGSRPPAPPPLPATKPKAKLGRVAQTEDALRGAFRRAIGGDQAVFTDPVGERVNVGSAIIDHILEHPSRRDGREAYFPLIPELLTAPQEIWIGFAVNVASGRVSLRRRYFRLFDLGKNQTVAVIADADGGQWSGMTFLRGRPAYLKRLRSGLRIYAEE